MLDIGCIGLEYQVRLYMGLLLKADAIVDLFPGDITLEMDMYFRESWMIIWTTLCTQWENKMKMTGFLKTTFDGTLDCTLSFIIMIIIQ